MKRRATSSYSGCVLTGPYSDGVNVMTGRFLRWGIDAARVILNREALIKRA